MKDPLSELCGLTVAGADCELVPVEVRVEAPVPDDAAEREVVAEVVPDAVELFV